MAALEGAVALVTGAASGIGLATARALAGRGARVAGVDLEEPPDGVAALTVRADVGDPAAWPEIVARVERDLGRLDVVHLNAGVTTGIGDITAIDDAAYRRIMRVNVDAVFYGLRATLPVLERDGGGAVVATASLAGLTAMATDPVYTATKHAVVGLVRSVAPSALARGVRVNAVCPGIVATPLLGEQGRAALDAMEFPLLAPEDIAAAVLRILDGDGSGECWYCQPGREPEPFVFRRVPGPRVAGKEGMRPPI